MFRIFLVALLLTSALSIKCYHNQGVFYYKRDNANLTRPKVVDCAADSNTNAKYCVTYTSSDTFRYNWMDGWQTELKRRYECGVRRFCERNDIHTGLDCCSEDLCNKWIDF
ncbi:hypothetical protein PRIPAC_91092 [Pristionchus pacificus]|uniref:Uncharacterized protein n=1 Tax=Pristionchus pacificus TaxID=54126 RepID=A0A2A6B8E8_PRIPA|nr:hypothetical protein PRIPAC_91092 [Pristionchus pacificus]|eukprot:PDM62145.1 hypothetical protein PRIPAC_51587 [Pristionchus pacificus]